jgi:hypothetical protein
MKILLQKISVKFNLKKSFTIIFLGLFLSFLMLSCHTSNKDMGSEKNDMYDGPELAARQEIEMTKDPATGRVPTERLLDAIQKTVDSKNASMSKIGGLSWIERGPNSDATGPSNGNTRANSGITSGRIRALMVDSLDATNKTVWVGGVDGGLWKTTDITASPATWTLINDNLSNLAIAAICQDPRPGFRNNMYFCTGESYFNADAVRGNGVFKSTDGGETWSFLASTSAYLNCTRILCDYLGNVYLGTRGTGLLRSTDGGTTWTNITPSGFLNAPNSDICDLEINSTSAAGRLHVVAGIFSTQAYRFTDIPATVAAGTWTAPTTAFPSFAMRAEIAVSGNTLYAAPANGSYQVPTMYKSTDGGDNWAATAAQPGGGGWANGQGWYSLSVVINPADANQCIVGGLDNYKTTNGGTTWTKISNWVGTSGQYVHADDHKALWFDSGNKLIFASDGGIFYTADGGTTIRDRNVGLRIKQFYSVAIHPVTTNYFLAGAQDNGTHQLANAGLGASVEVTGGDGAFVAIDQDEPLFQYGSYVFNQYRRSTDGGVSWSSVNLNAGSGQFINPYDFDNTANIMYCGDIASNYRRWTDPHTGSTSAVVNITSIVGSVTAVSVSPYTANRVFFGTNSGKVVQVDGANVIASGSAGTDRSTGLPGGTVSCINFGTNDLNLMCCESNYGINNVWVSTDGGATWTTIDGNLPDMPVRWCMFYPGSNTKAYIATETGVWETDLINGASTVWDANPTFPTVQTDMIKYRSSDRTIAAATHGRGVWTATIPSIATPDLSFQYASVSATEYSSFPGSGCRGYTDYKYFMVIANAPAGAATVTLAIAGGATATQGVDYAVTTNGNFAAPSMTLNFANNSSVAQPFTIRVYNDDAVESAESFTLNYTVAGGNAQAGATNQTMTFTINDNDVAPPTSTPISTVLNSSKSAYLGPNDDVYFYDASGNVMARIKNNTAFDYGCTTVQVDRAGSATTSFWNNNAINFLTNKTFKVTPTNANPTGNYDITLYYSAAEKTGYETATGGSWVGVQMVKTVGQISGITPGNPQIATVTINSVVTQASFGTNFSVKATFTNGFSGFGVGKPGNPLPVSLLSFDGRKNGNAVDLTWKTAFEYNNNRFEIETSKDASIYYKIGTVNSQGNSIDVQSYTYTDILPMKGVNYYRLKQVDMDGHSSYSRTVAVTFDEKGNLITLFPNPSSDKLNISFASPQQIVLLQIRAADGKLVRMESASNVQRNIDLNINELISGIYFLEIMTGNEKKTIRFFKE